MPILYTPSAIKLLGLFHDVRLCPAVGVELRPMEKQQLQQYYEHAVSKISAGWRAARGVSSNIKLGRFTDSAEAIR
jgi:hypothetical protein